MKKLFPLLMILIGLSACQKDEVEDNPKNDPSFAQELRESPETIAIEENNLILNAFLSRDFMLMLGPNGAVDGSSLVSVIELTEIDDLDIPSSIVLIKQFVIYGDEVWTSDFMRIDEEIPSVLKGVSIGGPKWEPDARVDVVCEFKISGQTYRILAKSQSIDAVY